MIKDTGSKFDDYSISPKIRQVLLHWGYESTEKVVLLTRQINLEKWVITGLTENKSYTKQKKDILKKVFTKQRSNKRKVKKLIQNLARRRKRQD